MLNYKKEAVSKVCFVMPDLFNFVEPSGSASMLTTAIHEDKILKQVQNDALQYF